MSLRTRLDLVILAIGLFSITLVYFSGQSYLNLAFDTQRAGLSELIRLKVDDLILDLKETSRDLSAAVQRDSMFRPAFTARNGPVMGQILDERFHQYFVTAGMLKLEALQVLDSEYKPLVTSTGDNDVHGVYGTLCPDLARRASRRQGVDRLKPMTLMCQSANKTFYALISPIGLKPSGYLVVISDPARYLLRLEADFGMPMTLSDSHGIELYRSEALQESGSENPALIASYVLKDNAGNSVITISMHRNLTEFQSRLSKAGIWIMLIVVFLVLVSIGYVRHIVAKIVLDPLQALSKQLREPDYPKLEIRSDDSPASHEFSELQELYGALHDMAVTDVLTGLPNRRQFERNLNNLIANSKRDGSSHILCYLDLDNFKIVNDTCGHIAGDELLRAVAELFRRNVRESDLVARLGGDEFGILLANCTIEKAVEIATQLLKSIQAYEFVWEEQQFHIGVSIGIATISRESSDANSVLSRVDSACYTAKESGKNQIHIYQEQDSLLAKRKGEMQWVSRINKAIAGNRFQLWYQPVVPIVSKKGANLCCELLLRMKDKNGELVGPGAFMPAAERYGLMPMVDRWVIDRFFSWLGSQPNATKNFSIFFINISGQSLNDKEFIPYVKDLVARNRIDSRNICFEITETVAITQVSNAIAFIDNMRQLGFRFSLDNFGTGLSSFAYLKTLPVDFLKIDGTFVRNMVGDPIDCAMVRAIHEIGEVMGVRTIAEHVEDQDTIRALQDMGVAYAQGYGILPPRPLAELEEELSDSGVLEIEPEDFEVSPAWKPS